eukprot:1356892-Amphidinium_carterae.1
MVDVCAAVTMWQSLTERVNQTFEPYKGVISAYTSSPSQNAPKVVLACCECMDSTHVCPRKLGLSTQTDPDACEDKEGATRDFASAPKARQSPSKVPTNTQRHPSHARTQHKTYRQNADFNSVSCAGKLSRTRTTKLLKRSKAMSTDLLFPPGVHLAVRRALAKILRL